MSEKFAAQLTAQIGEEFAAHQQYLAVAIHYDAMTLPQIAGFFYTQAREESGHARMMIKYLIDTDQPVRLPAIAEPKNDFDGVVAPLELAVAQEGRVTEQITELTRISREEGDYTAEQFMQWFLKEQVEEVATMKDLLTVARRTEHDLNALETYVERDLSTGQSDPTAPAQAGA